jgi:hypothetical protein
MPQPFARFQLRSFALAGTVPVPSPFPEVGRITLVPGGLVYGRMAGEPVREDLVVIDHAQSNRLLVRRRVLLRDVAAVVFAPLDACEDNWYFGPEIGGELGARAKQGRDDLLLGIAYVREQAPVLMQVEVGMTAAESAEYYPPPVGEATDDHYALQAVALGTLDCDTVKPHPARFMPRDCDAVRRPRGPRDCERFRPGPKR